MQEPLSANSCMAGLMLAMMGVFVGELPLAEHRFLRCIEQYLSWRSILINRRVVPVAVAIALLALSGSLSPADARGFRMAMMPNVDAVGASCNTCHTSGGGTPRNAFGLAMEALVTPNGQEVFWGPELAALDSDGDGVPNGVELGDPTGSWTAGSDQPGDAASITHPGDDSSFIQTVTVVGEASWAMVKTIIRGQ